LTIGRSDGLSVEPAHRRSVGGVAPAQFRFLGGDAAAFESPPIMVFVEMLWLAVPAQLRAFAAAAEEVDHSIRGRAWTSSPYPFATAIGAAGAAMSKRTTGRTSRFPSGASARPQADRA
jgi:hypothetical protein